MNNKKLGTAFEQKVCKALKDWGFWVHFITPDARGAQPFDIIAVKDRKAMAVECKTLSDNEHIFRLSRLEENQKMAFQKWIDCGNQPPLIAIEWRGDWTMISYALLLSKGKVDMNEWLCVD